MSFKTAVAAATNPLNAAFKPGKQALGKHSVLVECAVHARITGSVEIDETVRAQYPRDNRWDYGLGYQPPGTKSAEVAIWVEVHSAHTSEVATMLKKLDWLKRYLGQQCPDLWQMTPKSEVPFYGFVWISSGGNHILNNTSQARQLAMSGIYGPVKKLPLP